MYARIHQAHTTRASRPVRVVALDGLHQADVALLDEVHDVLVSPAILVGDLTTSLRFAVTRRAAVAESCVVTNFCERACVSSGDRSGCFCTSRRYAARGSNRSIEEASTAACARAGARRPRPTPPRGVGVGVGHRRAVDFVFDRGLVVRLRVPGRSAVSS